MTTQPLPDAAARERIRTDLACNMLVEAGAGSGKTTSLVDRMLEHVRTGTPVERLTAVTFTRKAANELRERFQVRLERAVVEAPAGSATATRCEQALRELDRAFLGTIHSFCARLLRERPLEVGLDPGFQELSEETWADAKKRFWRRWVERAKRDGDADVSALTAVGVEPASLFEGFQLVGKYPDVGFPLGESAPPDVSSCRRELDRLLAAARRDMPSTEPRTGWDDLMKLVRRLEFRRSLGFEDVAVFCDVLESISTSHCKVTQNRWSDTKEGKVQAKGLGEDFTTLLNGPIADVLRCWREHRYPIVMRVLQRAAIDFARERHATGQLCFDDLLLLTVKLLRENGAVRDELGSRYRHLLVDEFQDTDPIQAEVCFLLTSSADQGDDWRTVIPRPGSLFVVGDPKQSIFRFRRADIQIYELVKQRMQAFGAVLPLTSNFRSVCSVEAVVNGHFSGVFPRESTPEQAPFVPMVTQKKPEGKDGVYFYKVRYSGRGEIPMLMLDCEMIASWIASRIDAGEKSAGDFMVLTATKAPIERYARALSERNIAVTTTGAKLPQEHELRELLVVLRAIADPENAIGVVAALEGLFFGLSPADLWTASRREIRFVVTHPPSDELDPTARALLQLHEWWKVSQRHPADVLLERILDQSGLFLHAAAQTLGDARAGALLHLVESLRAASVLGASGLPDALEHLETLLSAEAADAPLRPGRTDAVRVMNLHKAKGLEADVVVLAAPLDRHSFPPTAHITRGMAGQPVGGVCISVADGQMERVIAHPPDWAKMQVTESCFDEAEKARLLYVAATRAKRELVVAQSELMLAKSTRPDDSLWRPLAPALEAFGLVKALTITPAPGRKKVERTVASLASATQEARDRLRDAGTASARFVTVTEEAARAPTEIPAGVAGANGGGRGTAWGSAVHRSLEALGRGRSGESLRAFTRAVAVEEGLDAELTEALYPLIERTADSDAWKALLTAGALGVELSVMRRVKSDGVETITEGIIDAAALGPNGWHIVDWKTDVVDDEGWRARHEQYTKQINAYMEILQSLSGRPAAGVVERVI